MRVVRLFGAVLTILTAGLLLASPAGAQPPSQLRDHITDTTGALTDPGREAVSSAIDRLYRDRHIQLWVVYVDNFSRYKPDNWAAGTRSASGLGGHDALLAIATNTKAYSFTVPPQVQGPTAASLNSLRRNQIEPVLGAKDWSGAAVAAADGLDKLASSAKPASPSKPIWPLVAIGVIVVVLVVLLFVLYRARRRRRALGGGHVEGHDDSLAQALSTADARVRQISDYVARHRDSVGSEAQARLDEAKRHVAAAHGKESTNDAEAIAHANRASTLAAQAQTLANDNVLGRQGARRGRSRQR
ncbi:TPM domain-containing protein [Mycobacterium marseillense]|uniref:TPM domain-containing protein n=1 Tax=Mycobacterium marseillense TaxID=701042 RepID=UPI00119F1895|nr:TPM domain-containing protein [Mycobacterium marseillense]